MPASGPGRVRVLEGSPDTVRRATVRRRGAVARCQIAGLRARTAPLRSNPRRGSGLGTLGTPCGLEPLPVGVVPATARVYGPLRGGFDRPSGSRHSSGVSPALWAALRCASRFLARSALATDRPAHASRRSARYRGSPRPGSCSHRFLLRLAVLAPSVSVRLGLSLGRRHFGTGWEGSGSCAFLCTEFLSIPDGPAWRGVLAHPRVCVARSRASNRCPENALGRSFALPPRVFGELGGAPRSGAVSRARRHSHGLTLGTFVR